MAYKRYNRWSHVPPTLATKTQLARERLYLPDDAIPVAEFSSVYGHWALYRRDQALALPPPKVRRRDYTSMFEEKYPDRRAAYLEACEMCFQMNRYAKWPSCKPSHREQIYRLKNALLQKLWSEGFCISAHKAFSPKKVLICNLCQGDGCYRCEDGVYRTVGGNAYWALRFRVDGRMFAWHQPTHLAEWAFAVGEADPHEVRREEKPVDMPAKRFAEAKALIAWVVESVDAAAGL